MLNSKRMFLYTYITGEKSVSDMVRLGEIIENKGDVEDLYALNDKLDMLLDMKVGDCTSLQFNRDNVDSLGVVKRIK